MLRGFGRPRVAVAHIRACHALCAICHRARDAVGPRRVAALAARPLRCPRRVAAFAARPLRDPPCGLLSSGWPGDLGCARDIAATGDSGGRPAVWRVAAI